MRMRHAGSPPRPRLSARLLGVMSLLSLLLCAAVVAVWVRSYWVGDVLTWARVDVDQESVVRYFATRLVIGRGGVGLVYHMQNYGENDSADIARIRKREGFEWLTEPRPHYVYHSIERG